MRIANKLEIMLSGCLVAYYVATISCFQTEMTTAERELDQNTNFDWNRIQESGQEVEPICGPGYTGLVNLGNRLVWYLYNAAGYIVFRCSHLVFLQLLLGSNYASCILNTLLLLTVSLILNLV